MAEADPYLEELWLTACESDPSYLERCLGVALATGSQVGLEPEAAEGYISDGEPGLPSPEVCPSPPARGVLSSTAAGSVRELVQLWEARAGGPPRQAGPSVEGPAVPSSPTPDAGGEGEGAGVVLAVAGLLPPSPPPEDVSAQPAASEPPEVDASGGQAARLWPAAAPTTTLRKDVVLPAWLRALVRKGVRARARDRARMRMGWLRAALAPARGQAAAPAATLGAPAVAGAPRA